MFRTTSFFVSYDEDGRLKVLGLDSGFDPQLLGEVSRHVAPILSLSGDAIDDQIVASLTNLEIVSDLSLDETQITPVGLDRFRQCQNLARLHTEANPRLPTESLQEFVNSFAECEWVDHDALLARLRELEPEENEDEPWPDDPD